MYRLLVVKILFAIIKPSFFFLLSKRSEKVLYVLGLNNKVHMYVLNIFPGNWYQYISRRPQITTSFSSCLLGSLLMPAPRFLLLIETPPYRRWPHNGRTNWVPHNPSSQSVPQSRRKSTPKYNRDREYLSIPTLHY